MLILASLSLLLRVVGGGERRLSYAHEMAVDVADIARECMSDVYEDRMTERCIMHKFILS